MCTLTATPCFVKYIRVLIPGSVLRPKGHNPRLIILAVTTAQFHTGRSFSSDAETRILWRSRVPRLVGGNSYDFYFAFNEWSLSYQAVKIYETIFNKTFMGNCYLYIQVHILCLSLIDKLCKILAYKYEKHKQLQFNNFDLIFFIPCSSISRYMCSVHCYIGNNFNPASVVYNLWSYARIESIGIDSIDSNIESIGAAR